MFQCKYLIGSRSHLSTKTALHCLADRGCSAWWCIPMDWGSVSGLRRGEHEDLHLVVHLGGLSLLLVCEVVPLQHSLGNNHRESGTAQPSPVPWDLGKSCCFYQIFTTVWPRGRTEVAADASLQCCCPLPVPISIAFSSAATKKNHWWLSEKRACDRGKALQSLPVSQHESYGQIVPTWSLTDERLNSPLMQECAFLCL